MPRNKLTIEQVAACLVEYKHISARKLGKEFGVSHTAINNIRTGESWKTHVQLLGLPLRKSKETIPAEEEKTLQPTQ